MIREWALFTAGGGTVIIACTQNAKMTFHIRSHKVHWGNLIAVANFSLRIFLGTSGARPPVVYLLLSLLILSILSLENDLLNHVWNHRAQFGVTLIDRALVDAPAFQITQQTWRASKWAASRHMIWCVISQCTEVNDTKVSAAAFYRRFLGLVRKYREG